MVVPLKSVSCLVISPCTFATKLDTSARKLSHKYVGAMVHFGDVHMIVAMSRV